MGDPTALQNKKNTSGFAASRLRIQGQVLLFERGCRWAEGVPNEGCLAFHESELWKSKAGVLVYKDRGGFKIDLATGQN